MRRAPWFVGAATAALVAGSLPLVVPAGASAPTCRGERATIVGTGEADELEGTNGDDVIVGLRGNDDVRGRGGDDLICGGPGSDRLSGGSGADELSGGRDLLDEDAGGPYLRGDLLDGGDGDDLLLGGRDPRPGARRMPDTVSYEEAPSGVVVDLSGTTGVGTGHGNDTIQLQPRTGVRGSRFADHLVGSDGADHLNGFGADDRIEGRRGDDRLLGESVAGDPGHDTLVGGRGEDLLGSYAGRDTLRAGPGDDFVEAYSDRPAVVRADAGHDYVAQNLTAPSGSASDGGAGYDVLVLYGALLEDAPTRVRFTVDLRSGTTTAGTDPAASGTVDRFQEHRLVGDLAWRFHGSTDRDRVWAITGGPLRARTYGGDDWVRGTPRADVVDGGPGRDEVIGGGGSDTCRNVERGGC